MFRNALMSLILATTAFTASAQDAAKTAPKPESAPAAAAAATKVRLNTNMGAIVLELDAAKAPKTVENFLQYVNDKHYDGTVFHRVIDGFMIQGGGFTPELVQKPMRAPVVNEADNGLHNTRGTIAMARTPDPNSATAQFFINVVDNKNLDHVSKENGSTWGYTVFGKVISGLDVVDSIRAVATGAKGPFGSDVPVSAVVINSAEVVK